MEQEGFLWIESRREEYLSFLRRLVCTESHSFDRAGVIGAGRVVEDFVRGKGFSVVRQSFARAGDGMLILSPGKEAMAPVCFVAHLDTVFPAGTFPDRLKEENGFLHGPGVVDCKGGIAVALLAMEALRKVGCPRSLRLLLTPDEEVSNRLSGMEGIRWIQDNSRGCAAAFVCECGTQGEAVTQRKGVLKAQVIIRGKSVHAGMFYDQGASAIREAAYKILQLEEHSEAGGITYNCGKIAGGEAENRVPDHCSFSVDIRFCTEEEKARAIEHLEQTVRQCRVPGTSALWRTLSLRSPMPRSEEGMSLFSRLQRTGERYGLERLRSCFNGGGSDAAYTVAAGVPTVCGVGATGFDWHSPRERMDKNSLTERAKLLAATIADWNN